MNLQCILLNTVWQVTGLRKKSHHRPTIAYTDKNTVKLDFDNTKFKTVQYWASRANRWFKLGGFLILKTSESNYHVVFNRSVYWSENMRIVAWVCQQSKNHKLTGYLVMQCIKEASTLRVSPEGNKPSPRIVFRYGKQDKEIRNYLKYRRRIKNMIKKIVTSRAYVH